MFHMKHPAKPGKQGSKGGLEGVKPHARPGKRQLWQVCAGIVLGTLLGAAAPLLAQDDMDPDAPPPGTVTFREQETRSVAGGEVGRNFSYSWPPEAAAVPALVRRFTAERAQLLADQKADFAERLLAYTDDEGCFGCDRELARNWSTVAQTPRFLVMSGLIYNYSGGAHGNTSFDALIWDRQVNKAFDPRRMFRSETALQSAIGAPWCEALKVQRAERLGEEGSGITEDDTIFPCPPIAELQLLPGTSDGQLFDRIELLAAQYVAGSYAEGVYAVTLPVTPAVLDALKPGYKAAFVPAK
jgi:hypothetical protein